LIAEGTKVAYNTYYSLVPHPLGVPGGMDNDRFLDQCRAGYVRDWYLTATGPTFTFGLGILGGLLCAWLAGRLLHARPLNRECRFWLAFVPVTALLGIASHPTVEILGVSQICGQSLMYLGLAFLAARFLDLPVWARLLGLLGWIVDFALGIFLQVTLENLDFRIVLGRPDPAVQTIAEVWLPGAGPVNWWGMQCWSMKVSHYAQFWGDHFVGHARLLQLLLLLLILMLLGRALYVTLRYGRGKKRDIAEKSASMASLGVKDPWP
jgi:hypothetical protein